jgi:SPP1 gp7 family putative phage head morphogenesis protein
MLDALIQHQANAYRASTALVNEMNKQFTTESNAFVSSLRDILDDLTESEKRALTAGKYNTDRLKDFKQAFDDWYASIAVSLPDLFVASAAAYVAIESGFIAKIYDGVADITADKVVDRFKTTPVASGALFNELFKDLAQSARNQALYAIREGINSGLTNQEIIAELRGKRTKVGDKYIYVGGIVEQAKNKIEANVRTARSALANAAYNDTFAALGYEYRKFLATLDGRTTKLCASLDGTVWKVGDPALRQPALHFSCRSILVGVDKDGNIAGKRPFVAADKPLSKIPKDERGEVTGQVSANTKFPSWFANQDAKFQKEWLGDTRYNLYKQGNYTIDKFVDTLGKEYTLKELQELDQEIFKKLGL